MDISDLITSNRPVSNHEKEETQPKKRENPDQEKNWGTRYTLLFEQQQWIHKMHPIKGTADRTLVGVSKVCNSQNTSTFESVPEWTNSLVSYWGLQQNGKEYGTLELAARAFVSGIGQSALNGPLDSIDDKQS